MRRNRRTSHLNRYVLTKMMLHREIPFCFVLFVFAAAVLPASALAESSNLSQLIDTKVERIAIDPGFGGKDLGAPGCKEGLYAKDINLEIAKKLARKIRERLHLDIIMTRTGDQFVTLERRTAVANRERADLFVSIHCNSHEDNAVYGIETYFLNLATDARATVVAARENSSSENNIKDLQKVLNDLMLNAKITQSRLLASYVQESLYQHMKDRYSFIENRGIKEAPFYVLIGAEMPSILIEVSFLSNSRECERLISEDYQDNLCEGIMKGIEQYIRGIENRN